MEIAGARFNIIHHYGDPNVVTLDNGVKIYKQEQVWIREYSNFVKCAPYGNHFCFLFPENDPKRFPYFAGCSCGSAAILLGSNAYSHLGSPEGMMLCCMHHATYNRHADGSK